ncbi:SAM-dependent methyltransferase [Actinokineospora bangkokensis]|uniref:Methyltransferase n=1 Tax=Actinokineospora bangkokensis TaxID=1193682 RepID=A0A1Q9LH35_9PSEU|nr:SAM-dependent methyltransferase [Actinokineospora bangkokensis]OLR91358.1 hypothetical protein BJP25_27250 [Actinokineospora bangkokensis]
MSGPSAIDPERPHPARIYDYLLGGACNFAPDREFANRFVAALPEARTAAVLNRDFLRRAVRYCRAQGVDQFLDLGSGIPTVGNVHETAPDARVVYVDSDPIAVAHSEIVLADTPLAAPLLADMLDAESVLDSAPVRALLDLDRPVAVLMVAVLHFVPDPHDALRQYIAAMAPGSHLVISHGTRDAHPEGLDQAGKLYRDNGTPGTPRDKREVEALFTGTTLLPPGVVWTPLWHPDTTPTDPDPRNSLAYAGVGRKP